VQPDKNTARAKTAITKYAFSLMASTQGLSDRSKINRYRRGGYCE
jgi:hypothetical protein